MAQGRNNPQSTQTAGPTDTLTLGSYAINTTVNARKVVKVDVGYRDNSSVAETCSGVTFGGAAMTQIGDHQTRTNIYNSCWARAVGSDTAAGDIVVSMTGNVDNLKVAAVTLIDTTQTLPTGSLVANGAVGGSTVLTLTATAPAGNSLGIMGAAFATKDPDPQETGQALIIEQDGGAGATGNISLSDRSSTSSGSFSLGLDRSGTGSSNKCGTLAIYAEDLGSASVTATGSLDAAVQKQLALSSDLAAAIQAQRQAVVSGDAALLALQSATSAVDACLRALASQDTSLDAALRAQLTRAADLNAGLQSGVSLNALLGGALSVRNTGSVSLGAALERLREALTDIDAALVDEQSVLTSTDAVLVDVRTHALALAAALQRATVLQGSLDAALRAGQASSSSLDGALQGEEVRSLAADAALQARNTVQVALTGIARRAQSLVASLDASLTGGTSTTLGADLDSALVALKVASLSFSAAIQRTADVSLGMAAVLEAQQTLAASLGVVLRQEVALFGQLDAVLRLLTVQVVADAAIQQRDRFEISVLDAFLQAGVGAVTPRAHRTVTVGDDGRLVTQQAGARLQRPSDGRTCIVGPDGRTIIIPESLRRN